MMTVDEYLAFDRASEEERYEYIDGIVILRVRGTRNSSHICVNITGELSIALRGKPCQVFGSDLRVSISATCYVYPDIFVSCEQSDFEGNNDIVYFPRVIFEVLSLNAPVTASSRRENSSIIGPVPVCKNMSSLTETKWPLMFTGEYMRSSGLCICLGRVMMWN